MTNFKRSFVLTLFVSSALLLGACETTGSTTDAVAERTSKIDSVLNRAANSAAARGETGNSLAIFEKVYKRNSSDAGAALQYARALRESDYLNRASLVLSPFAAEINSAPGIKTEYAAVQLALGHYDVAEDNAQQAILQNSEDYRAFHYLGIALDAKGQHEEAERSFRKGLDSWEGDPTPIMNNLALNLTAQGFLDEAAEILQRAAEVSPGRPEVERNLRIVNALQQSDGHRAAAPKPNKKPLISIEPQAGEEEAEADEPPASEPPANPVKEVEAQEIETKSPDNVIVIEE